MSGPNSLTSPVASRTKSALGDIFLGSAYNP
jgi:hypothetical protein